MITLLSTLLSQWSNTDTITFIVASIVFTTATTALLYQSITHVCHLFYTHCLDPAPPWNITKTAILYWPRHHRKHGRLKFIPRYPMIHPKHIRMAILFLLNGTTPHQLDSQTIHILRTRQWASPGTDLWTMKYYDIDTDSFGSHNPSDIVRHARQDNKQQDPLPKPFPIQHDICLHDIFPSDYDPSSIVHILRFGDKQELCYDDAPAFFNTLEATTYNATHDATSSPPLIVDSGASVCISPNRSDFVTYHPSRMNIKDLSSTNTVAGEGQLAWTILDVLGHEHHIQLPGYHISQAQVRLLSPQVLLRHFGGHAHLTSQLLQIRLDDGSVFDAPYCPRTSLPCLQIAPTNGNTCFWSTTFDFTHSQAMTYPSLLTNDNTNLSAAQKELLLWHHRLSHASL